MLDAEKHVREKERLNQALNGKLTQAVDDIKDALSGATSNAMNGIAGYDLSGVYSKAVELKPKRDDVSYQSLSIEFKGLNTLGITSNMCVLAIAKSGTSASLVVG